MTVAVREIQGRLCYVLHPRRGSATGTVLYFHGGAYIYDISPVQWRAVADIAARAGQQVIVPIYPLAPLSTAAATTEIASSIARDVLREAGDRPVTLMGDSAGGGLAMAAAQILALQPTRKFSSLVLVSPWLDVAVDDPESERIEPADPMLHQPGLQRAGRLYAGALPLNDPRVSPIHGPIDKLPPTLLFSGTADILHPDSERFHALARRNSVAVRYWRLPHGQHVFPFLPTREGKAARRAISEHIRQHQ